LELTFRKERPAKESGLWKGEEEFDAK
jgi:hypothetical protein